MDRLGRWLACIMALALGGCSATDVLAGLTASPKVAAVDGLAYGPGPREGIDVYLPRGAGPHPVAVFFYGGGWDSGARRDYRFVGQTLAAQGVLTFIPDYRVYPEVRYPAFLEDCAKAVRWAKDHAAAYGGDPGRLFLIGHSAGAYNAVMLGVDRRWLAAEGMDPRRDVRGIVGLAGPYDFLPLESEKLKIIFGPEQGRPDTQPINHVDGQAPPMLLLADRGDKIVLPRNTIRMAARVRAAGGEVQADILPHLSHPLILGALAWPLRPLAPVNREVMDFIRRQGGG